MLDVDKIKTQYDSFKARYEDLVKEVEFSLEQALEKEGIKIHGINKRVKGLKSIIKKCEDKEINNPFVDMRDIAGVRIVCLFRSDLGRIENSIKNLFDLIETDNKIDEADGFGYMSIHYIFKLGENFQGPRYNHIKDIQFEIQSRTLCMDAWAAVSHHLSYKGNWDVPSDLERAMNALSGLFYVADNEFLHVYEASIRSKNAAEKLLEHSSKQAIPVNFDTVAAYMKDKLSDRTIPGDEQISRLVNQMKNSNYNNIKEVDEDFSNAKELFEAYENKLKNDKKLLQKFSALGALRVALSIANHKMESFRHRKVKFTGYSSDVAPFREKYLKKHKDRSVDGDNR